jgi:nucleoside-diphosphate-sugar epimerase
MPIVRRSLEGCLRAGSPGLLCAKFHDQKVGRIMRIRHLEDWFGMLNQVGVWPQNTVKRRTMRIFMTGASGYIGGVVAEKAIEQGHEVIGLARSEVSREKLKKQGVTPFPGDLESLDLLARGAAEADAVLHLGFVHDFTRPYEELIGIDKSAVRAMAKGIAGTGKPLITTSGTGVTAPDPNGAETNEDSPLDADPVLSLRAGAEADALSLAASGIRVNVIRLAPYVYGRGGSVFVPVLLKAAAAHGFAAYVDGGKNRTSSGNVDDVARLYLLAMEKAAQGTIFNGTTETDIPLRNLAEAIGAAVGVPAKSVSRSEADAICGPFVAKFLEMGNRASSAKATRELGWQPQSTLGLLEDIVRGSYRAFAESLKQEA